MRTRIPPPVIGVITLFLIWLIAETVPGQVYKHPVLTALALILAVIGLALDLYSLKLFRDAKTTFNPLNPERAKSLVLGGPYKFTRNPMYLGMLFILTGFVIFKGHAGGFLPLAGFVAFITVFQIKPEEEAMIAKFGEAYKDYMTKVRRWL